MVKLLDVVRDPQSKTPSLIFEFINNTDFKVLYPTLKDHDVRYYIYQILKVRGVAECSLPSCLRIIVSARAEKRTVEVS